MDVFQIINTVVLLVGVPTIVKVLVGIGGKLKTLDVIDEDIRLNIKPDLKDLREKFSNFEIRFTLLERDMRYVEREVGDLKSVRQAVV